MTDAMGLLRFSEHALDQMALRGIDAQDAEAVFSRPTKTAAGKRGGINYYGYGPVSGFRIRVTVYRGTTVATVAWAGRHRKGAR